MFIFVLTFQDFQRVVIWPIFQALSEEICRRSSCIMLHKTFMVLVMCASMILQQQGEWLRPLQYHYRSLSLLFRQFHITNFLISILRMSSLALNASLLFVILILEVKTQNCGNPSLNKNFRGSKLSNWKLSVSSQCLLSWVKQFPDSSESMRISCICIF